jgi:hypothetical protein
MTLSVQARDRYGNIFAKRLAGSAAEALAIFSQWIADNPDLDVEIRSPDA